MLPATTANRFEEEAPKRGGAEGGRFTGSTDKSGPMKPGNSVEEKTLMIRWEESLAGLLTARTVDRGSRERKVTVIRLRNRNSETGPENAHGVTESVKKKIILER